MAVRPARSSDLPEIEAMIVELAVFEAAAEEVAFDHDEMQAHLFGPHPAAQVLIATPDYDPERTAGMAVWFPTFSTWVGRPGVWLEDLFVRPDFRRLGLATELLWALAACTEGRIEWSVLHWNAAAISLYDGLGARPVEGWSRYRWSPYRAP